MSTSWTPSVILPVCTYTVSEDTVDSGDTCVLVVCEDGTPIDPSQYQPLFDAAIIQCRLCSSVSGCLEENLPDIPATVSGINGGVQVATDTADIQTVTELIAANYAGQNVTVVSG